MEYKSPIEILIEDYLNEPKSQKLDLEYNRRYLQSLNEKFRTIQENPENLKELVELYIDINKHLTKKDSDSPLQISRKLELRKKLLIYSELGLKSISITENLDNKPTDLKGFKSLRSKLLAEKTMIYIFMFMTRKQHNTSLNAFSALKINYMMTQTGERARDDFFKKIKKMNRVFDMLSKKKNPAPIISLKKAFLRWKVRANYEFLRICVEKIACNHRLKKETTIWRLKKLILKDKSYRKTKRLEATTHLLTIYDMAKKRIELNDKNFFLYSLMLISAKMQREEYAQKTQSFFELMNNKLATKMNTAVDSVARNNPRKRLLHTIIKAAEKKNDYCLNTLRMLVKRKKLTTAYRFFDLVSTKLSKNTKTIVGAVLQQNPKKKLLETFKIKYYANLRRYFLLLKRKANSLKDQETMLISYTDLLQTIFNRKNKRNVFQHIKNIAAFKNNYSRLIDLLGRNQHKNELREAKKVLNRLRRNKTLVNKQLCREFIQNFVQRQIRKTDKTLGILIANKSYKLQLLKRLFGVVANNKKIKINETFNYLKINSNELYEKSQERAKFNTLMILISLINERRGKELYQAFTNIKSSAQNKKNAIKTFFSMLKRQSKFKIQNTMKDLKLNNQLIKEKNDKYLDFASKLERIIRRNIVNCLSDFYNSYRLKYSQYKEFYDKLSKTIKHVTTLQKRRTIYNIKMHGLQKQLKDESSKFDNTIQRNLINKICNRHKNLQKEVFGRLLAHKNNYLRAINKLFEIIKTKKRQNQHKIISSLIFHKNTYCMLSNTKKRKLASIRLIHLLARTENLNKLFLYSSMAKVLKDREFALSVLNRSLNHMYKQNTSIGLKVLTNHHQNQQLKHLNILLSQSANLETNLQTRYKKKILSHLLNEKLPHAWINNKLHGALRCLQKNATLEIKKNRVLSFFLEKKTDLKLQSTINVLQKHSNQNKLKVNNYEFQAYKILSCIRKITNRKQTLVFENLKNNNTKRKQRLIMLMKIMNRNKNMRCLQILEIIRKFNKEKHKNLYLEGCVKINYVLSLLIGKQLKSIFLLKYRGDILSKVISKSLLTNTIKQLSHATKVLRYNNLAKKYTNAIKNNILNDFARALDSKKYRTLNALSSITFKKETKMKEKTKLIHLYKLKKHHVLFDLYKASMKVKGNYIKSQYKCFAIKYIINYLNKDLRTIFNKLKHNRVLRNQENKKITFALYKAGKSAKKQSLRHLQAFCGLEKKRNQIIRSGFVHLITAVEHKKEKLITSMMSKLILNSNIYTRKRYVVGILMSNLSYLKQLCLNDLIAHNINLKEKENGLKNNTEWKHFVANPFGKTGTNVKNASSIKSEPFIVLQVLEKLSNTQKIKVVESLRLLSAHRSVMNMSVNGKIKSLMRKICINKSKMFFECFKVLQDRAKVFRLNKILLRETIKKIISSSKNKKALCFKYLKEPFWKRSQKIKAADMILETLQNVIYNTQKAGFIKLIAFSDTFKSKKTAYIFKILKEKSMKKTVCTLSLLKSYAHCNNDFDKMQQLRSIETVKYILNKPVRELYRLSFIKLISLSGRNKLRFADRLKLLDLYIAHERSKNNTTAISNGHSFSQSKISKNKLETVNMDIMKNNKELNTENYNLKQSKKYLIKQIKDHENLIQKIKADNMIIMKEKEDFSMKEKELLKYNNKLQEEIAKLEEARGQSGDLNGQKRYSMPQSTFNFSYSTRFETLTRENQALQPELNHLHMELQRLNAEKLKMEELLNQYNKEREAVEDELDRIENETERLLKEIKRIEQYNSHLIEELKHYKDENQQLSYKNDELKNYNTDLLERIKQLNKDIEDLELKIKELEKDLIDKDKIKTEMKENNDEIKSNGKIQKKENEKLKDTNLQLENEILVLQKQIKGFEEQKSILNADNNILEHEIQDLEVTNQHLEQQKISSERIKTKLKTDTGFLLSQRQVQVQDQQLLNTDINVDKINKKRLSLQTDKLGSILSKLRIIDDNVNNNNQRIEDEDKSIRNINGSFLSNVNEINMKKWKIENNKQLIFREKIDIEENEKKINQIKDTIKANNDIIEKNSTQLLQNEELISANIEKLKGIENEIAGTKNNIAQLFEDLQEKKNILHRLKIELDKNNYHIQSNTDLINRNLQRQNQIEADIKDNENDVHEKKVKLEKLNRDISDKKFAISDFFDKTRKINDDVDRNNNDYDITMNKLINIQNESSQIRNDNLENIEAAYQSSQNRATGLNRIIRNLDNLATINLKTESSKPADEKLIELNEEFRQNCLMLSDTKNIIIQKHIKLEENNMEVAKAEHVMQKTNNKLNSYDNQISKNNALIAENNEQLSTNTKKIDEQKDILMKTHGEIMNMNKILQDVLENKSRNNVLGSESPIKHLEKSRLDVSGLETITMQLKSANKIKTNKAVGFQSESMLPIKSQNITTRLFLNTIRNIFTKQIQRGFNVMKFKHFIKKQFNRKLSTMHFTSYINKQDENVVAETKFKTVYMKPLQIIGELVNKKTGDHYHHFKLITHLKICKMYLNSLFRWKVQNMEYNHKKALVRAKVRRHHLPLLLMQMVYKTKAGVFKTFLIDNQKLKLQKYYSKLLPVIINGENHYKNNLKNVLRYWYEIKDENKWFIKIMRNIITQTAIEPQIALWRMKMYRPPKLFVNPKIKLGLTQLVKVVLNNQELDMIRTFWEMERAQLKIDTSLEFDDEFGTERKKTINETENDNLSLEFSSTETEKNKDLLISHTYNNTKHNEESEQQNFNNYLHKVFFKTLIAQTKRTKAYYLHRLLYFMLKEKKNDIHADITRIYNTNSHRGSEMNNVSVDQQAVAESMKLLVDENLLCKEMIESKESMIKNLNEQLAVKKADIQFLKNHYMYSFLNRIEFFIRREKRNEMALALKRIKVSIR